MLLFSATRKYSPLWNYFKDLGNPLVRCKLCGSSLSGNKSRHLKFKHREAYKEIMRQQKSFASAELTFVDSCQSTLPKHPSWYRKFMTKIDTSVNRCNLCHTLIKYNNMKRHLQIKHSYIFEQETSANNIEEENKVRNSRVWMYFKDAGNSYLQCKLCKIEVRGNMEIHLKQQHPAEYLRLQRRRAIEKRAGKMLSASGRNSYNQGWVRKYVNKLIDRKYECDVCKQVLTLSPGFFGNMRRHFKAKHPFIFAKETNQSLDSDGEDKTQENEDDKEIENEMDDKEENTHEEDKTLIASGTNYIGNRGWIKKFCKQIGVKEHECKLCKQVLSLPPGKTANMIRHFKSRHPYVYAKETNITLVSNFDDQEEKIEEQETTKKYRRGWVKKYSKKINAREHQCNVCKKVLRVFGLYNNNNMIRHFKFKHPFIHAKETNQYLDSDDENETDKIDADDKEEIREGGRNEEEYIIEYLVENTPAENSSNTIEEQTDTD